MPAWRRTRPGGGAGFHAGFHRPPPRPVLPRPARCLFLLCRRRHSGGVCLLQGRHASADQVSGQRVGPRQHPGGLGGSWGGEGRGRGQHSAARRGKRLCGIPPAPLPLTLPVLPANQVNVLLPGAINTPFLNTMLANQSKLKYILGRIPLGEGRAAACQPGGFIALAWVLLAAGLAPCTCLLRCGACNAMLCVSGPFLPRNPRRRRRRAGRLGIAEDMVGPALFLASHASDYVTGAELLVDGGGMALPMLAGAVACCFACCMLLLCSEVVLPWSAGVCWELAVERACLICPLGHSLRMWTVCVDPPPHQPALLLAPCPPPYLAATAQDPEAYKPGEGQPAVHVACCCRRTQPLALRCHLCPAPRTRMVLAWSLLQAT